MRKITLFLVVVLIFVMSGCSKSMDLEHEPVLNEEIYGSSNIGDTEDPSFFDEDASGGKTNVW